ncbi:RNA-guided endonuclease InsQ/TnpB family protein [Nonomuraea terrae]|uniref:RNA-guided endonuclease InsQ/TnpB family protein n=1 Tax=Nonomuraea terrae TaxID=2530383 RepID=UPI0037B2920F
MRRSFRFLLRLTGKQAVALTQCLEDHRQLYNAALEHRRTAYAKAGVTIRYGDQSGELKHIRADGPEGQARWSFSSQQATLRRLDKAFAAFFARVEAGRTPGFPRFKGRGWFDAVEWPRDGDGCRWDSQPGHPSATFVRLQGGGHVPVHRHRPVRGLAATADRLAAAQRDLARKKRGSTRRLKEVARIAALCGKVGRQRVDYAHKVANALVRGYDVIVHEGLRIANMTRSASGTVEAPGRNVAQKSGLNRNILDAGWGVFLTILSHKAERAGRELIAVNPAGTSRTCARCGHCVRENRVTQAEFRCQACGHAAHADVNAAINILRAGLALRRAAEAA